MEVTRRAALVVLVILIACTPQRSRSEDTNARDATVAPTSTPPVEPPPECDVLCISDATVRPGQNVEVTFEPPAEHIWGVSGEIWRIEPERERVAHFAGGPEEHVLGTVWAKNPHFILIGYYGNASWTWRVPQRLDPGIYELRKDAVRDGDGNTESRRKEWHASFEVIVDP